MYLWLTDFLLIEKIKLCDKRIFSYSKDRVAINFFKLYLKITWLACRHTTTNSSKTESESLVHEIVLKLSSP